MTFQVSDIKIKERHLRYLVLLHSVLAFAFSTMIVMLGVNIVRELILGGLG